MRIRASVRPIQNPGGVYEADFLVDTGALHSMAPVTELQRIGIEPVSRGEYELADGTVREFDCGYAEFDVLGRRTVAPVLFGSDNVEPLLGVTALESAGFEVDPVRQTLRRLRMHL